MSYDIHEAFSLDSLQDSLLFWDDFEGDSLKDLWRVVGTATVIDAQDGGICRITTGALTNNNARIDWAAIRSLLISKKVTMEVRAKLVATAAQKTELTLYFDGSNLIRFLYDTTVGANWLIETFDGGANTQASSGIAADTDYHIYRIEAFPTGEVHFYIDGVETANSPITTNIPDDAADYLEPYLRILTREDVAKSMDVDYIYLRQLR